MTVCMLPASPSWYCSRVIDTNDHGVMCFGGKQSIYIVDTVADPPLFIGQIPAHQDRVVGVSFCFHGEQNRLCTVAEDGKVKIWNIQDKTLCCEHSEHKYKLTAVHWSPVNPDLIISGDEKGGLVVYHPNSGDVRSFLPEANTVFCLTFSPHEANYVAVGYKNGQILLLDINKKAANIILKKFRGHEDEIHSIVWCPCKGEELNWRGKISGDRHDVNGNTMLATGSRDKTVRVWSLEETKPVYVYKLSQHSAQKRGFEDTRQRVWVTLYWPKLRPQELIFSSYNGDMFLWDLSRPGKPNPTQFMAGAFGTHSRIVFNIAQAKTNNNAMCSISMDRNIILWNAETLSSEHIIPSLGGFVYCLVQSPINSGCIAAGIGDNLIRVWNVENPQQPYSVRVFWQGIKSKVTCASWHPKKEGHLAFGTDDGKVGIMDIFASRSYGSSTYHKKTVYVISWGPATYTKDKLAPGSEFALYSCGDCAVLQHFPDKLDENAVDIATIIKHTNSTEGKLPGRSEISWKPDFSILALGNDDGSIEIFKPPHLELLCSVQVHRKLVNCVRWHPEYTPEHAEPSRCRFWIASGSNEAVIQVVDLKKSLGLEGNKGVVVTESFRQLEGHTNRITSLSWSPHTEGMLASASYDWTAQVWNVTTGEPVANYRAHNGRLLFILWSALDPDIVYSGGDDFTVQAWQVSKQTDKAPPVGCEKRKHKSRNKTSKTNSMKSPEVDVEQAGTVKSDLKAMGDSQLTDIQLMLDRKKAELMQASQAEKFDQADNTEEVDLRPSYTADNSTTKRDITRKELKDRTKRKVRSLFPLSSTMDNRGKSRTQEDCVTLVKAKSSDDQFLPADHYHLGHYLDRKNTYKLFDEEVSNHLNQGSFDQYVILETFRGNTGESIRNLTGKQELNDFTVALASAASPSLWKSTCEAYSAQLEREGNYQKAAAYLLAVHKVYEAIDLLQRNNHYKDALCLARVRLSPSDPVLKSLYASWGHQLAVDGNFELAAKCFIANNQPLEATRLIARRAEASALRVAAEVCLASDDMLNARIYSHKFVKQCLLDLDWKEAAQLVNVNPELKLQGILLSTHQTLLHHLHLLGCLSDMDIDEDDLYKPAEEPSKLPWMMLKVSDAVKGPPWETYTVHGEAFLHHLIRQWCQQWQLSLNRETLENLDGELTQLNHTRQAQTATKQILVEISGYIALAAIKLLQGNTDDAAYWICVTMEICHKNHLLDIWAGLCQLLLPTGADKFHYLAREARALRLASMVSIACDIEEIISSKDSSPEHCYKAQDDAAWKPYDDSLQCSAVSCMEAYYNLRVLLHYANLSNEPSKQSSEYSKLNVPFLLELSHSLLRNIQIEKFRLHETLLHISRATAVLISQHGDNRPLLATPPPPSIDCSMDSNPPYVYPVTPNIQQVSVSAFQRENEQLRSQMAYSPEIATTTGTTGSVDEYVAMNCGVESPKYFSNIDCNELVEGSSVDKVTPIQDKHYSPQKQLHHPDIPERWYQLSVDEKYTQSYVDLKILCMEQAHAQNELTKLHRHLKNVPFPNPEESITIITMVSKKLLENSPQKTAEMRELVQLIVSWGLQFCYSKKAISYLMDLNINEM